MLVYRNIKREHATPDLTTVPREKMLNDPILTSHSPDGQHGTNINQNILQSSQIRSCRGLSICKSNKYDQKSGDIEVIPQDGLNLVWIQVYVMFHVTSY